MLKRSLVIAIVLLLATAAGAQAAATLTTAPFPGTDINAGSARCLVTNAGTKPGSVTMELIEYGVVLDTTGPLTVSPGGTAQGVAADLSGSSPSTCRITVPSKSRFRGSFAYFNGGGVPPTVIPAQ